MRNMHSTIHLLCNEHFQPVQVRRKPTVTMIHLADQKQAQRSEPIAQYAPGNQRPETELHHNAVSPAATTPQSSTLQVITPGCAATLKGKLLHTYIQRTLHHTYRGHSLIPTSRGHLVPTSRGLPSYLHPGDTPSYLQGTLPLIPTSRGHSLESTSRGHSLIPMSSCAKVCLLIFTK